MIFKVIAATIGVLGFAITLFSPPKRSYAACAFCGGIGYLFYLLFSGLFNSYFISAVLSSIVITIIGRILAVALQMPATIFLVSGILPLVPGSSIYYASYYLMTDQWELFKSSGVEAVGLAGAIALGMMLGSELSQKLIRHIAYMLQKLPLFKHFLHH